MRLPGSRSCLAILAATLLAAAPARAAEVLVVRSSGAAEPAALVEGLRLRVHATVELQPDAAPGAGRWILDVLESPAGTRLVLTDPDGRLHERTIPPSPSVDEVERVRELSLQVGYLAEAAAAPFAESSPRPPPAATPPADPERIGLPLELALLGVGDVWGEAQGEDLGFWFLGRIGLRWSWGLWTHVELGWQRVLDRSRSEVVLDTVPIRLGLGADILWNSWEFRAALQAIAEYWTVSGDALHPNGWRGGAGLLVVGGYRIVSWCSVGLEAGLDLTPRAVQIDYHEEPLLALGQLRWRAGVWAGFELAGL